MAIRLIWKAFKYYRKINQMNKRFTDLKMYIEYGDSRLDHDVEDSVLKDAALMIHYSSWSIFNLMLHTDSPNHLIIDNMDKLKEGIDKLETRLKMKGRLELDEAEV